MEHPIAVANYFIDKSIKTGEEISPMKLLKLVYIAHGWYLGIVEDSLIGEAVEAWKYGPVVPTVYHAFKHYGNEAITSLDFDSENKDYPLVKNDFQRIFLDKIWEVYKKFSAVQLSALTHVSDSPWDIVWNKENGKFIKSKIIPTDLIKDYYQKKLLANKSISNEAETGN